MPTFRPLRPILAVLYPSGMYSRTKWHNGRRVPDNSDDLEDLQYFMDGKSTTSEPFVHHDENHIFELPWPQASKTVVDIHGPLLELIPGVEHFDWCQRLCRD